MHEGWDMQFNKSGRHFLQIPGPTNVPDRVLRAMDRPTIDHRGPEFGRLANDVLSGIKQIFKRQPNFMTNMDLPKRLLKYIGGF